MTWVKSVAWSNDMPRKVTCLDNLIEHNNSEWPPGSSEASFLTSTNIIWKKLMNSDQQTTFIFCLENWGLGWNKFK